MQQAVDNIYWQAMLDTRNLEKQIAQIEQKFKHKTLQLELSTRDLGTVAFKIDNSALDKLENRLDKLNNHYQANPLTPKVDDSALTELNEHFKLKKDDWDDLIGHLDKNPLKPKIDDGSLSAMMEQTDEIAEKFQGIVKLTENMGIGSGQVDVKVANPQGEKLTKAIDKFQDSVDKFARRQGLTGAISKTIGVAIQKSLQKEVDALVKKQGEAIAQQLP